MNYIKTIIWLFPILFIFHDFEEIIFMKIWILKNKEFLSRKFPILSKKMLPHFINITSSSFALGVAEEFIIISIITIASYITNSYLVWIGFFIAFTLHLIMHCFQALLVKKYIPAIVTSTICLPICIYIINTIIKLFPLNDVIVYSILGFIIMIINIILLHKGIAVFSQWQTKYIESSKI